MLLIVAPTERKVRIEVGYGLEGELTDAVSRLIIENAILPRFRAGDFAGGITRGVDDIISVLTGDAAEWQQRAAARPEAATQWGSILVVLLVMAVFGLVLFTLVGTIPRNRGARHVARRLDHRPASRIRFALVVRLLRRLLRRGRIFRRRRLVRRRRVVGKLVRNQLPRTRSSRTPCCKCDRELRVQKGALEL